MWVWSIDSEENAYFRVIPVQNDDLYLNFDSISI